MNLNKVTHVILVDMLGLTHTLTKQEWLTLVGDWEAYKKESKREQREGGCRRAYYLEGLDY